MQRTSEQFGATKVLPSRKMANGRSAFARRLLVATGYIWIWAIPVCLSIRLKWEMLTLGGGYRVVARSLGRIEPALNLTDGTRSFLFSFWERLSFFRGELLWGCIVLPVVAIMVGVLLPRRIRALIIGLASMALVLLLYAEQRTLAVVGRFLSYSLFHDALIFGRQDLQTAGEYLSLGSLIKLGFALAVIIAVSLWALRREFAKRPAKSGRAALLTPVLWIVMAAVAALSWFPWMTPTTYHSSLYTCFVRDFFGDRSAKDGESFRLSPPELLQRYRELVNAPEPRPSPAHWGKARDCDVILFVLETCPARCVPLEAEIPDFPTLARLRQRAWIATHHYTTYPYTNRAVFSLLTSWYPPSLERGVEHRPGRSAIPGLMGSLKGAGYATALYASDKFTQKTDDETYERLGIERRIYSDTIAAENLAGISGPERWKQKERLDVAALEMLRNDMMRWHRENRRFAAVFLPQLGHAPWPDNLGAGYVPDIVARGRAVMARQDRWLMEIVEQLERAGRLEKTLIVVTGDHGVRTRAEDPGLAAGVIDEYSFKVPLLIYAPMARVTREDVSWLTSHIDLTPSLLDLLGISRGRDLEQGAPLWDERLATRTTFFFAHHYHGSDGFHERGRFYMRNYIDDAVYASNHLGFGDNDLLREDAPERGAIVRRLAEMTELQEAWVRRLAGSAPERGSTSPGGLASGPQAVVIEPMEGQLICDN